MKKIKSVGNTIAVENELPKLLELVNVLVANQKEGAQQCVIPFIGAGASIPAGLPDSKGLFKILEQKLLQKNKRDRLSVAFDKEARFYFKRPCEELSLFEYASIISKLEYGRSILQSVVSKTLTHATRRPLAFELLSHLALHRYVNHFVSLNFDELLEESLHDEVSDRRKILANTGDAPSFTAMSPSRNPIYVFKPFGTLSTGNFRVSPDEIKQYGPQAFFEFMLKSAFPTHNVYLLLVGYGAREEAFGGFIEKLKELDGVKRAIHLFVIDPSEEPYERLSERFKGSIKTTHINLEADQAFDLILRLIHYQRSPYCNPSVWVSDARHRVAADTFDKGNQKVQLKIELILQAIKSRGFFTVEAVAGIPRFKQYANAGINVLEICNELCHEGIFTTKLDNESCFKHLRLTYALNVGGMQQYKEVAKYICGIAPYKCAGKRKTQKIVDWIVVNAPGTERTKVLGKSLTRIDFIAKCLKEIAIAPHVEVDPESDPASQWHFKNPVLLKSIDQLCERTSKIFEDALAPGNQSIEIYGIWTSGVWIFDTTGWAWETIGERLDDILADSDDSRLKKIRLVLADGQPRKTMGEIPARIRQYMTDERCDVLTLEWWRHNRLLTLLRWQTRDKQIHSQGIYMRRRLASPVVAPVFVQGDDCKVLEELFHHYTKKAQNRVVPPEKLTEYKP